MFVCAFQVFRWLESPAEELRVMQLRENVIKQREYLINNLTFLANITDLRNLDYAISSQLEKYELVRIQYFHFALARKKQIIDI